MRASVVVGGRIASYAVRPVATKGELALRKKNERANTTALMATLELLAPNVAENKRQPGHRCKALRGRAKDELLKDVMHAVRLATGLRSDDLDERESTSPHESYALSTPTPLPRNCIVRANAPCGLM